MPDGLIMRFFKGELRFRKNIIIFDINGIIIVLCCVVLYILSIFSEIAPVIASILSIILL